MYTFELYVTTVKKYDTYFLDFRYEVHLYIGLIAFAIRRCTGSMLS